MRTEKALERLVWQVPRMEPLRSPCLGISSPLAANTAMAVVVTPLKNFPPPLLHVVTTLHALFVVARVGVGVGVAAVVVVVVVVVVKKAADKPTDCVPPSVLLQADLEGPPIPCFS